MYSKCANIDKQNAEQLSIKERMENIYHVNYDTVSILQLLALKVDVPAIQTVNRGDKLVNGLDDFQSIFRLSCASVPSDIEVFF